MRNDNNLNIPIRLVFDGRDASSEGLGAVAGGDNNRNKRIGFHGKLYRFPSARE